MKLFSSLVGYARIALDSTCGGRRRSPAAYARLPHRCDLLQTAILEVLESRLLLSGNSPIVTEVGLASTVRSAFDAGSVVPVTVSFSDAVFVSSGVPTLTLNVGGTPVVVNYASGTATNTLEFDYTVTAGQNAATLECESSNALLLNGATIKDAGGDNAFLTLPTPGSPKSLSQSEIITIDTTAPDAPTVLSPTSPGLVPNAVVTITGTAEPNAFVRVTEFGEEMGSEQLTNGNTSYSIDAKLWDATPAVGGQSNYLGVVATDAAGNSSAATALTVIQAGSLSQTQPVAEEIDSFGTGDHPILDTSHIVDVHEDANWSGTSTGQNDQYTELEETGSNFPYVSNLTYVSEVPALSSGAIVPSSIIHFTTNDPSLDAYTGYHLVPIDDGGPDDVDPRATYTCTFTPSVPAGFDPSTLAVDIDSLTSDGISPSSILLNGNPVTSLSDISGVTTGVNTLVFVYTSSVFRFSTDVVIMAHRYPEQIAAQPDLADNGISLSWNQTDPTVTNYEVERSDGYSPYQVIYSDTGSSFIDNNANDANGVIPGATYTYQIKTTSSESGIAYSNVIQSKVGQTTPTVTVLAPSTAALGATAALEANVSDPVKGDPVQQVKFFADGVSLGTGTLIIGNGSAGTWSFAWQGMTTGLHHITAVATTASGESTTSPAVTVNISDPSPVANNVVFRYFNNFESGAVGPEWSSSKTSVTPIGDRRFLGEFGYANDQDQIITLSFGDLPLHNQVTLSFDLYMIETWGGNWGEGDFDAWTAGLVNGQTFVEDTFSNTTDPLHPQSYPGTVGDSFPGFTGSAERNTLGYFDGDTELDSVYHFSFTFPSTAAALAFEFHSLNGEEIDNESWGLDNVQVTAQWQTSAPPVSVLMMPENSGANQLSQGSPVTLRAQTSDTDPGNPVTAVNFYDNGNPIGTGTLVDPEAGAWSLDWIPPLWGSHTITAEAIDADGDAVRTINSRLISVADPSSIGPPTIESVLQTPVGSTGNVFDLQAVVQNSDSNTGNVTYYWAPISWPQGDNSLTYPQFDTAINGTTAASDMEVTLPSSGTYDFQVTTFNGHKSAYSNFTITISPPATGTAPSVELDSPSSGAEIVAGMPQRLVARASDFDPEDPITSVIFYVGGASYPGTYYSDSQGGYWIAPWIPSTSGPTTITAQATESHSISTSTASLSVNVLPAGTPPAPLILVPPAASASVIMGDTVALTGDAYDYDQDTDSSIILTWHASSSTDPTASVFFDTTGTNSFSTNAKFSALGTYQLWFVASYPDGASSTSASVTVTVLPVFRTASVISSVDLQEGATQQLFTSPEDQFGNPYDPSGPHRI